MDMTQPPTTVTTDIPKERKKYTGVALRILNLLVSGVTQEQAAQAVGVTPGFVSQLCLEEDFQLTIVENIKAASETAIAIDNGLLGIELQLTDKLKTLVPWMTTADQVLKALRYVNEAKRKTNSIIPQVPGSVSSGIGGQGTAGASVRIVLPTFITQNFVISPNREIVAIGDKELVTLDTKQLNIIAAEQSKQRSSKPLSPPKEAKRETSKWSSDPWSDL